MSLELAITDLTAAIKAHTAALIAAAGSTSTSTAASGEATKATRGKAATKEEKKPEPAAEEEDPFAVADEKPKKEYTIKDVQAAMYALKDHGGANNHKDEAVALMKSFGVKSPAEIKPEQYADVIAKFEAALKKLG